MRRGHFGLGATLGGGVGLLIAIQMFVQWQLDLDVSLTPYEIGFIAALFFGAFVWVWVGSDHPVRTPAPIALDTTHWHFGRNAPILAAAVVAFLAVVALLSIVLPKLDPVVDTTVNRFASVPLVLIGLASVALDRYRYRSTSARGNDSRTL